MTLSATVELRADGSGTVEAGVGLDGEAVRDVGDVAGAFAVDDLRQAGWRVRGPLREDDGLTWVRASKAFATPAEATAVMVELNGPDGPFRDFRVTRDRSLLHTRTSFSGTVDLTRGLGGLADPDLRARLGDFDPGLDVEGLRRRFGPDLAGTVRVRVTARLPGTVSAVAPRVGGGEAAWSPELGARLDMRAKGDVARLGPLSYASAAVGLGSLALMATTRRRRRRRAWG